MQISPLSIFVPDLYERIFDPNYIPETADDGSFDPENMFFPTSDEDFEAMMEEWSDMDGVDMSGVFQTPDLNEQPPPGR